MKRLRDRSPIFDMSSPDWQGLPFSCALLRTVSVVTRVYVTPTRSGDPPAPWTGPLRCRRCPPPQHDAARGEVDAVSVKGGAVQPEKVSIATRACNSNAPVCTPAQTCKRLVTFRLCKLQGREQLQRATSAPRRWPVRSPLFPRRRALSRRTDSGRRRGVQVRCGSRDGTCGGG